MRRDFLKGRRLVRFEAIQHCIVPLSRSFTEAERRLSAELVNTVLAEKSPAIHFKIAAFLGLIDAFAIVTGGKTFASVGEEKRNRIMRWFFDCPIGLLRKGFWGINTLAKMGVYGQEGVYGRIAYALKETPR